MYFTTVKEKEIAMGNYYTLIRMSAIYLKVSNAEKNLEEMELSYSAGEKAKWYNHLEKFVSSL